MLHYLLQTLAFQLVFLLVYEIFLKKETFFGYNRAYLLLTPLLALLLPLLHIPQLQSMVPEQTLVMLPEVLLGSTPSEAAQGLTENAAIAEQSINWWYLIYGCGILLSLLLFLNKFRNMKNLFRLCPTAETEDFKIVQVPDSKLAFTFFRTIFIGDRLSEQEKEQILNHEKVHVQQRHSLDLLYFEFLRIVLWFNPLIYIFQARITELHEFIADSGVVKKVEKQTYYQQLLNSAFNTEKVSFINQFFNHSLIKKRIVMLQKSRSKAISKMKYLILVPLMLGMMVYVSCSEEPSHLMEDSASLDKYSYTLVKGQEMSAEIRAKHNKYENFLKNNPNYVSWASVSPDRKQITYSIHSVEEDVPEGYKDLKVHFPAGGKEYTTYTNLQSVLSEWEQKVEKKVQTQYMGDSDDISLMTIDEVPVFPGCGELSSNEARRNCMSEKITEFIRSNFNASLGKELGLKGMNKISIQFRINTDGAVEVLATKAPHPALKAEAERVVNSLPQMEPGKQDGKEVGVIYAVPIAFEVSG